jgi:hypothetical protein
MVAFKSSSKNARKLNLQPISNNRSFETHMELELGRLGIVGKLVKDAIKLWRVNFEKKNKKITSYRLFK